MLRPRLIERLNAGLRRKLTLISAPAGFGKTTLVSEWVQAVGRAALPIAAMGGATPPIAIAWLSLDESDNDPTRFLAYFVAALQTIEAKIGKGALGALQSPQPPPTEAILTALVNEIAAVPDRIILVLDDYRLIGAQPIHDALTFLLRHLPLFSDLLRHRLHQNPPPLSSPPLGGTEGGIVAELHIRASEWYEQNGFTDEAIEHALRAEDYGRAAHLIEEHVDALWQRGEHTRLRRWLAGLPVELVFSKPHLCILYAWDLFTSGQQDAAERSLQAAEKALGASTDLATATSPVERDRLPGSDGMKLRGRVAATRASLAFYRGDVPGIIRYSRQALEYLPEQGLAWRSVAAIALGDAHVFKGEVTAAYQARLEALEASKAAGNAYIILIASMKLAVSLRLQGRLGRVTEICQQQLQLANESGLSQTAVVGWLLAIRGEVLAELDDLDGAIHRAKKGAELTESGKDVAMLGWSYLCLTRVLFSRGDMADAEEIIEKMENIAREYYVPPWITNLMAAWQARIWLAQDKLDAASQWVRERALDADRDPTYLHEMEYIALARILIAQGRLDETARLLQRLHEATETGGRTSRVIQIIAQGLTNPEIASRLFLSLNTVKVHARNIYGKLSVHSCTQAIARSQQLGLLPRR